MVGQEGLKTVLVDMDGVMADFDSAAVKSVPLHLIVPRAHFYVAEDYAPELHPQIEATYNAPGFFENLKPMPGLLEAWQGMLDWGYNPRVASAPLSTNETSVSGKIQWLNRILVPEFGPNIVEQAIFDKEKWKYPGIALLDDRPNIPRGRDGKDEASWEHILFGWPHMEVVPEAGTNLRLKNWHNKELLASLLNNIVANTGIP